MTVASPVLSVEKWFSAAKTASVELPDGWFGRPYDNMHRLTWVEGRPEKLFVELDEQLYLILSHCVVASSSAATLELSCDQAVFDWRTYGRDGEFLVRTFPQGGVIRFHASGA